MKIILTEEQLNYVIKVESEPVKKHYTVDPDKVLLVKRFLDKGFKRGNIEQIGSDGMPSIVPIFGMLSASGQILKNMYEEELQDLLVDKFKNMFSDKDERMKFLGQVMRDWYNNKIGLYGSLSVNHL